MSDLYEYLEDIERNEECPNCGAYGHEIISHVEDENGNIIFKDGLQLKCGSCGWKFWVEISEDTEE